MFEKVSKILNYAYGQLKKSIYFHQDLKYNQTEHALKISIEETCGIDSFAC